MENCKRNSSDSLRERIAKGECVSPYTTDHCPVCVDVCEAFRWKIELEDTLKESGIDPVQSKGGEQ